MAALDATIDREIAELRAMGATQETVETRVKELREWAVAQCKLQDEAARNERHDEIKLIVRSLSGVLATRIANAAQTGRQIVIIAVELCLCENAQTIAMIAEPSDDENELFFASADHFAWPFDCDEWHAAVRDIEREDGSILAAPVPSLADFDVVDLSRFEFEATPPPSGSWRRMF
jgi:hypothetical protein